MLSPAACTEGSIPEDAARNCCSRRYTGRKYVDYKMEGAPVWDGEQPESKYREYARNLKLWLIEAEERLPENREEDHQCDRSMLAALMAHLTVEEITDTRGYVTIVRVIEEHHDYLKDAKLEQALGTKPCVGFCGVEEGRLWRTQEARFGLAWDLGRKPPTRSPASSRRELHGGSTSADQGPDRWFHRLPEGREGHAEEFRRDSRRSDCQSQDFLWQEYHDESFNDGYGDEAAGGWDLVVEETDAIEYLGDYMTWVFYEARDKYKGKGKSKGGFGRERVSQRGSLERVKRGSGPLERSLSTARTWITGRPSKTEWARL